MPALSIQALARQPTDDCGELFRREEPFHTEGLCRREWALANALLAAATNVSSPAG